VIVKTFVFFSSFLFVGSGLRDFSFSPDPVESGFFIMSTSTDVRLHFPVFCHLIPKARSRTIPLVFPFLNRRGDTAISVPSFPISFFLSTLRDTFPSGSQRPASPAVSLFFVELSCVLMLNLLASPPTGMFAAVPICLPKLLTSFLRQFFASSGLSSSFLF